MKSVTVYMRDLCSYSARAMKLLKAKNVPFETINAGMSVELKAEMVRRANGGATYPQIFIGDLHIGGCDEMVALEKSGKLDALLKD